MNRLTVNLINDIYIEQDEIGIVEASVVQVEESGPNKSVACKRSRKFVTSRHVQRVNKKPSAAIQYILRRKKSD